MNRRKLSPAEAWDLAVSNHLDDEAERVAKMTDEELDRDLRAKGLDPAEVRAKGKALAERLRARKSKKP